MKEEQKSELLKRIRKNAKEGLEIVEEKLKNANSDKEEISELLEFQKTLEATCKEETIEGLKSILKEDVIPIDMFMEDDSWEELQRLIFYLHEEKEQEKER